MKSKIAKTSNGHCLDRALSVMRLALGYEAGLPKGWNTKYEKYEENIIELLPTVFPGRSILVWISDDLWQKIEGTEGTVIFKGMEFGGGLDAYLTAFIYAIEENESHIVIGEPAYSDISPLEVSMIFSVEI